MHEQVEGIATSIMKSSRHINMISENFKYQH